MRVAEAFERDNDRKALVVMATGAGKTRTVIALCELLMRCNWAKRVLFLADRVALVNQAVNAFKRHLPDSSPVNLVTEKDTEGRVFVSTYPTMMGLIDDTRDGQRRFGVDRAVKDLPATYDPKTETEVRGAIAALLHLEVSAMNLENFVVRPRRRLVEKYAKLGAWTTALTGDAFTELSHEIAGLPAELDAEAEEAKRFDLLILNLQLTLLRAEPAFVRLREQVKAIAGMLEEKASIPMVRDQMALIHDVQTDEWWQDVTTPMLESVRRRLRNLVKLIEKKKQKIIYSDFEDEIGAETGVDLPGFTAGGDFEKFRAKARAFLRGHQDHVAIHKLRMNKALTAADVAELERMLAESGVGDPADLDRAKQESHGLGLFVRSLVGMDREAAKHALSAFVSGKTLGANQIEFVDLIVNHLTEHGVMDAALLYESPFTDLTPQGPDGLFSSAQIDEWMGVLASVKATAIAA